MNHKLHNIKAEKGDNFPIGKGKKVRVKLFENTGKLRIIYTSNNKNVLINYRKISKTAYFDIKANIEKEYQYNDIQTEKAVKRKMKKFRYILESNFDGANNELFITLTTDEECHDIKLIKKYFKKFYQKLKYRYSDLIYAYVIELQQKRFSWHIHLMIKSIKTSNLFISNSEIEIIWGQGQTRTTRIVDTPTDFEIDEEKAMTEPDSFIAKQKYYGVEKVISYMCKYKTKEQMPSYARIFSYSRNMKKPFEKLVNTDDIFQILYQKGYIKSEKDTYTTIIRDEITNFILAVIQEQGWIPFDEKITRDELMNLFSSEDLKQIKKFIKEKEGKIYGQFKDNK